MKYYYTFLVLFLFVSLGYAENQLEKWTEMVVSQDHAKRNLAIDQLRQMEQRGLDALMEKYISKRRGEIRSDVPKEFEARVRCAIDAVACQKHAAFSGLYWYTDLQQAQKAAKKQSKPILSLRLLGNLYDEFSCANSRFMRTVLYANTKVSEYLKENFILHWQSVRPVPVITIDFGDGRVLKRTITGNSIHYLLDHKGQLIDAIPGLYDPKTFHRILSNGYNTWRQVVNASENMRSMFLVAYHRQKLSEIQNAWNEDLGKLNIPVQVSNTTSQKTTQSVPAQEATRITVSKRAVEIPILQLMNNQLAVEMNSPKIRNTNIATIELLRQRTSSETWTSIAALHSENAKLDTTSKYLIAYQNPTLVSKKSEMLANSPFFTMLGTFENNIAQDTVRNEYDFHARIHEWFIDGAWQQDHATFNERVYAEIFLTPSSDPWLGLEVNDLYTGLMESK